MTERQHKCRCGGIIVFDDANKRTMHSIPPCADYTRIINEGIRSGKTKSEGIKLRKKTKLT